MLSKISRDLIETIVTLENVFWIL